MTEQIIQEAFTEIKPGESLHTPEWKACWQPPAGTLHTSRSLEEKGFACMVLATMFLRGWRSTSDLPDDDELAFILWCKPSKVRALRPALEKVPHAVIAAELARMRRWPSWIVQEFGR